MKDTKEKLHKMNKKQTYVSPTIEVLGVALESAICAGSVDFIGEQKPQIDIEAQGVTETKNNDFSADEWEI